MYLLMSIKTQTSFYFFYFFFFCYFVPSQFCFNTACNVNYFRCFINSQEKSRLLEMMIRVSTTLMGAGSLLVSFVLGVDLLFASLFF